jgi:hypothetical protein
MNIVLWILQIVLALLFLFAGGTKFYFSAEQMAAMSPPNAIQLPGLFIKFIGACEILGAFGLVLLIIMIGAVVVTVMGLGIGQAVAPIVIALLCAVVAYGRRPSTLQG